MRLIYYLFLIGIVIVCQNASAQELVFSKYTVSDGLVNNSIRKIYQDSKGFLWISTWEGLSKYDGHRFTNFTESNGLSHNLVNDVIETPGGEMYVAMNNGTVDLISDDRVKQKGILNDIIINKFLQSQKGSLLALTDNNGIIEINNKRFSRISTSTESFYNLVQLSDTLYAAAADTLPVFILTAKFDLWSFVKSRLIDWAIANCVYKDQQNHIWLGTNRGLKIVSIDYRTKQISISNPLPPFDSRLLSQVNISSFHQQDNGSFWIGTDRGLINISSNGRITHLTENDGLPSRDVNCIFNDRENNLWIGTGSGLAKIIAVSPMKIHEPSQVAPNITLITKKISSRHVLVNSNGFFYRYNFQTGQREDILQLQKDKALIQVSNSSTPLFIYDNRLLAYDIESNKLNIVSTIPKKEFFFSAAAIDNEIIFLGSFDGLMILSNRKVQKDPFFSMRINNVLADRQNNIWIGTWNDGLFRASYDSAAQKLVRVTSFQMPDKHIRSIFEDSEGNIWVGTRFSGILKINANQQNDSGLFHLSQHSGLSSNWIKAIAEDEKGNIWVANLSGIDKLVKKKDSFIVFNYSRIISFFTTVNFITPTEHYKLLCASAHRIFQLTDANLETQPAEQVFLTKVVLGDSIKNVSTLHNIELAYSKNHALFEFTTPLYVNEKEILYSYRLNGSGDTAWSRPSNSHSVQYANLAPGHYRFEVRMLGWNGNYGPVTSFLFTVNPPYWKSWWFYLLIALLFAVLLYCIYRYRINQLLRLQKVRNSIATDLHDDIGSTLTNISILSELSKKNIAQPQQAKIYLERINEEVNSSGQALDDIIWNVNTRNDTMDEMLIRMRRFAAELFEDTATSYYLELDPQAAGKRLSMEQRRDIYLVFKESINNIFKHAEAKNVWINLSMVDRCIKLTIRDDGKGFRPEDPTHRNGLNNIKKRVEKWKGKINISSAAQKGSAIEVVLPLNK